MDRICQAAASFPRQRLPPKGAPEARGFWAAQAEKGCPGQRLRPFRGPEAKQSLKGHGKQERSKPGPVRTSQESPAAPARRGPSSCVTPGSVWGDQRGELRFADGHGRVWLLVLCPVWYPSEFHLLK